MTDISSNDRAFITVAKDLLGLRNDIDAMELLLTLRVEDYQRTKLKDFGDRFHSPDFQGVGKALKVIGDTAGARQDIAKARKRLAELERLATAYVKGQDIVQAKLMGNHDE